MREGRRSRRAVLAAAGAVAGGSLAGCLGGSSPTEAEDPWEWRVELDDVAGVEGRLRLHRGEYWGYEISAESALRIRLRARSRLSLPFDAMTFIGENIEDYRAGRSADTLRQGRVEDSTSANFFDRLNEGEYLFVLDNTRLGGAPPFDEVDLSVRFEVLREHGRH